MFFKGTERRPTARTISTEIDAIGGEFNAFTGKEITGYYVKSSAETRDIALDVLVDMLRNSRFDPAEIEKEKGVILEEMNVYLDTPQRYVGNVYDRLLFADQPLGWDILGTRETIEGATRETFTSYLDSWYGPERIVVGVGGRIGDGLGDRLEELLGDIEPRETGSPRSRPAAGRIARPPAHEAVRAGAPRPRRALRTPSGIPTGMRSSSSPSCSEAACRRASSRRCANGVASPTTCMRPTARTPTRERCTPGPEST